MKLPRVLPRHDWHFSVQPGLTLSEVAGSYQRFEMVTPRSYIDLVTVKGSGHMVPTDRPGQSLQMIANFVAGTGNYDIAANISLVPQPLLSQYKNAEPKCTF